MGEGQGSISSIDWQTLSETLNANHVPEILLGIVGILALVIAYTYLRDKDSGMYKISVLVGVLLGVLMAVLCVTSYMKTSVGTTVIVSVACFALIIRPFRDVHFAMIFALLVMVVVYVMLSQLTSPFEILATGWPRAILAFVAGAVVYMLLGFLQELVLGTAKFLNAWPVLAVLGIICIVEAVCVYMGYESVYDTIVSFTKGHSSLVVSLLMR